MFQKLGETRLVPAFLVVSAILTVGAWVLLLTGPRRQYALGVGIVFAAIAVFSVLFLVGIVIRSHEMDAGLWLAVAAFVFTFATLLGAYAGLDMQAVANTHGVCLVDGKEVGLISANAAHPPHPALLIDKLDAIYFAITTLSTTGFGDIVAHSDTCRRLVVGEVVLGFPALGIAIAGVAARIFSGLGRGPQGPAGDQGPAGEQGPAGPPGPQGAPG